MTQNNLFNIYDGEMLIAEDTETGNILFQYHSFDNRRQGATLVKKRSLNLCRGGICSILNTAYNRNYRIISLNHQPVEGFETHGLKPVKRKIAQIIEEELAKLHLSLSS